MEEEKNLQEDPLKNNSLAKESSSFFDQNEIDEQVDVNVSESGITKEEYENSEVFDLVGKPKKETSKIGEPTSSENLENAEMPEENADEQENNNKQKKFEPFSDLKGNFDSQVQEAEEIAQTNQAEIATTVEKRVEEAKRESTKRTGRFMNYFYAICLVINIISFAVFLIITSQTKANLATIINSANGWWLAAAVGCFFATMLIEALRYYILILRGSKKSRLNVSYNTAAIGKFYDFITPLTTGGQALQITYLIKRKVNPSLASGAPVANVVYNQFCYLLIIVLLFIASGQPELSDFGARFIGIAAYIGLAWQFLLLFIVFFFSTSKRLAPACTIGVLKFLHKIKIIKDYRETYVKVLRFVYNYQQSFKKFFTDFFSFFIMFTSSVLLIVVRCLVPYFLYCAFNGFVPGTSLLLSISARALFCELAMGIWILPGNVIFADVAFMSLFRPVFGDGAIFWALLFWRLISYYFYIIQGLITVPITRARDKKFKKQQTISE